MTDFSRALQQLREKVSRRAAPGAREKNQAIAGISLSMQLEFLKACLASKSSEEPLESPQPLPEGDLESTPFGHHYVVRKIYSDDYFHGKVRLSRFNIDELRTVMSLTRQAAAATDRDRVIFLDTETTGLQGGTGMCPFLVGVGYFSQVEFHVLQFFIRDFDEEPSMLCALATLLQAFDLLITYNGAAFDVPLLETRFRLARLDNPFAAIGHFDLLNTARRLWRNGHGSCRLTALERELLWFFRGPDIAGSMIPRVYFDFLQRRAAAALHAVFTHNVHDVVSLAALTVHACDRVLQGPAPLDEPSDLYSLARMLEHSADWRRSTRLYELAIAGGLPEVLRLKALENLAILYRRAGEHERSFEICEQLIRGPVFSMIAYEGAAIYHERTSANIEAALYVLQEGLARLEGAPERRRWKMLLKARWDRLQQKVIGFPSSAIV